MKTKLTHIHLSLILLAGLLIAGCEYFKKSDEPEEFHSKWSYEGATGPENWANLDSAYKDCNGNMQSPINIPASAFYAKLDKLEFNYQEIDSLYIQNNGHTIKINVRGDNQLIVGDKTYTLRQFHFHCPSEHTIHNKSFPMEIHLVHTSSNGDIGVVAILAEQGAGNELMDKLEDNIPQEYGPMKEMELSFNAKNLLPDNNDYYTYTGSLTTPPCTEGVTWYVLANYLQVSTSQIEAFSEAMPENNARPTQALNGREILTMN